MLGESGVGPGMITQASWIRSLLASYVKFYEGRGIRIGGLFGAPVGTHKEALSWSRPQQAAFLIYLGAELRDAVKNTHADWADIIRKSQQNKQKKLINDTDPAFFGSQSLLNTDQGVRALLFVTNDLCFVCADHLQLSKWALKDVQDSSTHEAIDMLLTQLKDEPVGIFVTRISKCLASFDWRSASAPGLSDDQLILRKAFRGSGGYRELRRQLLMHLSEERSCFDGEVRDAAGFVFRTLGYDRE